MTKHDYSSDVHLKRSKLSRFLYAALGVVSLIVGVIGIFLPVLPTVPFILLTAFCFSRSSVAGYNLILNNPYFGKYIRDWRHDKSIPLETKIVAVSSLLISMGVSAYFFVPYLWGRVAMAVTGISVSIYLIRLPTRK